VVHEAFARALSRPERFAEVAVPEAWLRTVVLNVFRSRYRRRLAFDRLVRLGRVERQPADTPGISPDRVALVAALQQLPRGTREVLVLHHLADLPVVEVADLLQVSVSWPCSSRVYPTPPLWKVTLDTARAMSSCRR
jgi:RNA polymerase sigma-70 factor (ECF subfamily)